MADLERVSSKPAGYDRNSSNGELVHLSDRDDDGRPIRTGTLWTATAHIITAVIGSGVLSLAWSMAQLGWIAGPIVLLSFALVTYFTSLLLADCYRSPDSETGKRNYTYMDAVRANLGGIQITVCGIVQYSNLIGTAIGYTITSSISMVAIRRSNCFHDNGRSSPCHVSNNPYMIIFGIIEVILSQIPDFSKLWWLSILAAVMSISYSSIGLGLGVGKATETGHSYGTLDGVSIGDVGVSDKIWLVFQALGDVAFAYAFSMLLIEIQDTIKSPPPENRTMKKATLLGVSTTTIFYMLSGCIGYAAFGNDAPGNLLTGFGFYNPYWLVDLANACIVVHLVGAYQVFAQPVFAFVETWARGICSKSKFINKEYVIKLPMCVPFEANLFRLVWRTAFVIFTTLVAMLLPFFNDIVGILGATAFWPLTVYFPIEMYVAQKRIGRWTRQWIVLETISMVCLLVSVAALIGSIEGVVNDLKVYKPFKTQY